MRSDEFPCESYQFFLLQKLRVWYCNCSYLTVDSDFPLRNCSSVVDLVRQVQDRVAASLHEMLSASRRSRHGVLVASLLQQKRLCRSISLLRKRKSRSETCILRQNETLTQNITTIDPKFLQCEAQNNGVVVCTAGLRVHTRAHHGHDVVQMQAEDQATFDRHQMC